MKFEVSGASQAVLFEAARAAELSACSAANKKFREPPVSLDFLVLLYQDKRTEPQLRVSILALELVISNATSQRPVGVAA